MKRIIMKIVVLLFLVMFALNNESSSQSFNRPNEQEITIGIKSTKQMSENNLTVNNLFLQSAPQPSISREISEANKSPEKKPVILFESGRLKYVFNSDLTGSVKVAVRGLSIQNIEVGINFKFR